MKKYKQKKKEKHIDLTLLKPVYQKIGLKSRDYHTNTSRNKDSINF